MFALFLDIQQYERNPLFFDFPFCNYFLHVFEIVCSDSFVVIPI